MIRKIVVFATVIIMLGLFAGCSSLDVVGKESVTSFSEVLTAMGDKVTPDDMNGGFALVSPDDTVRFIWSKDYATSPLHDIMLEFDAQPFIDAGLDPERLPDNFAYYEDKLMVGTKLGNDALQFSGDATPLAAYEQIVNKYRQSVGYHTALDHYNVNLGDGNMFEWAKDMSVNDKDIVFVLNPEPLITAGVNPDAVEGWTYTEVKTDNGNVFKFLKPFDLR